MTADSPQRKLSPSVEKARDIIRGQSPLPPAEMLALAQKLMEENAFTYARRILARASRNTQAAGYQERRLKIYQRLALCTYKDTDLPADERLDRALDTLREVEDLSETKNQETLGLVGAIHKRKWEIDNQKSQLERALLYYKRGYLEGAEKDQGYTGINAAFVLDLLARQEEEEAQKSGIPSDTAAERRAEARAIRENVIRKVAPLINQPETKWLEDEWWFYSTLAEAHFGLGTYDEAVEWLGKGQARTGKIREWEYESTARQLAALVSAQGDPAASGEDFADTPAWLALKKFFGENVAAVRSAFVGKIGLGLSGGGFRASLFHIGVFARLAELDILRRVEVLSCVSGGSIIGAHYYLEVRNLLQQKADKDITREDYIELVKRMAKNFLAGVQRNIRMRVAAALGSNLKMVAHKNYTRTMRAGDLYESEIFSSVEDGWGDRPRWLDELRIQPADAGPGFAPKYHNWRREAKAPILILNAATLNTGHTWQFTASWMGEPPAGVASQIDGNDFLRRMWYEEAPDGHRKVRLGHAVSASACVPGLFEPLAMDGLYPARTIRMVDGGVCDNQGVGGLLEQDCTVLLISDGSGQMSTIPDPSNTSLGVPLRSNTILQARVRAAQYQELVARRRAGLLRGLMFVHLKKDLDVDPVDWVDCPDPFRASEEAPKERLLPLTSYGIYKKVQERLARVRTDLDSFSDVEACALMTSAYRMTESALKDGECVPGFSAPAEPEKWEFLAVEKAMKETGREHNYLMQLLGVSDRLALKVWKLSKGLKIFALAAGAVVLLALAFLAWWFWPTARKILWAAPWVLGLTILGVGAVLLLFLIIGKLFAPAARLKNVLAGVLIGIVSLLGYVAAHLHLRVFDKIFLRLGSLETFGRQGARPGGGAEP